MPSESLLKLQEAFQSIKDGPIDDPNFERLLIDAWDSIDGSSLTNLTAEKLGRMEDLEKRDGAIYFKIERHGGTINGSTRAELHTWEVDVMNGKATIVHWGRRQLYETDKRLNTKPIAQELAKSIIEKQDHKWLQWNKDKTSCKILISAVIPATNIQTTTYRRKKLRENLNKLLEPAGLLVTQMNIIKPIGKEH